MKNPPKRFTVHRKWCGSVDVQENMDLMSERGVPRLAVGNFQDYESNSIDLPTKADRQRAAAWLRKAAA